MAGDDGSDQLRAYDAKKLEPMKRRRSHSPSEEASSSKPSKLQRSASPADGASRLKRPGQKPDLVNANEELPQPFSAKSLEPAKRRARSSSPGEAPKKPPKRPGQRARFTDAEREAIRQRAIERERAAAEQQQRVHIDDVVRSHYNAVPERGAASGGRRRAPSRACAATTTGSRAALSRSSRPTTTTSRARPAAASCWSWILGAAREAI